MYSRSFIRSTAFPFPHSSTAPATCMDNFPHDLHKLGSEALLLQLLLHNPLSSSVLSSPSLLLLVLKPDLVCPLLLLLSAPSKRLS
eukprot:765043-Hanusia_phi.AAC.3